MTILLGILTPDFAMLFADTRASQYDSRGIQFNDDDTPKVFKSGMGLVAGAGWFDLVHSVVNRLEKPVASNQEMGECLATAAKATSLPADHPLISMTSWLMTYQTGNPNDRKVGLAYCSPQDDYRPIPIACPGYFLVAPAGMPDAPESQLRALLKKYIPPPSNAVTGGDLREFYAMLAELVVKKAAGLCTTVSPRFQVGYHSPDHLGVSGFIDDLRSQGVDWT